MCVDALLYNNLVASKMRYQFDDLVKNAADRNSTDATLHEVTR